MCVERASNYTDAFFLMCYNPRIPSNESDRVKLDRDELRETAEHGDDEFPRNLERKYVPGQSKVCFAYQQNI
jgi:hypothetical protein